MNRTDSTHRATFLFWLAVDLVSVVHLLSAVTP